MFISYIKGLSNRCTRNWCKRESLSDAPRSGYLTMRVNTGMGSPLSSGSVHCERVALVPPPLLHSHLATALLQDSKEPMPTAADVRRLITELCVLPLGKGRGGGGGYPSKILYLHLNP